MNLDFSKCKTPEDVKKIVQDSGLKEIGESVSNIGKLVAVNMVKPDALVLEGETNG